MDVNHIDRAFNALYDRTYRKTAAYLTARCRHLSDVEDLLQETYLSVYRILTDRGTAFFENEEAYVLSVAKSKLMDQYRKAGRTPPPLSALGDEGDAWLETVAAESPSPEEQVQNRETVQAVRVLVEEKEEPVQQAFYLHHCFGLSFPEIGKLQSRNESSVRSGVFRLTREIRGRLERSIS